MAEITLQKVGPENLDQCGIGCIADRKHVGYGPKVGWLRERFQEGLRFLLFRNEKGKPLAFLEYVPGEYAWRPVEARGWLFVHCLWVYPSGQKVGRLGSRLIQACVDEARAMGSLGVAAMVSDGPWMAPKEVFLKNGFELMCTADRFELVARRLRQGGEEPRFRDISGNAARYPGLHLVHAAQCPMLPRSVEDLRDEAEKHGLELKVTVLTTAQEAQNAPSYYGVFNLLWDGQLLSDHYVSRARFRNILKKIVPGEARRRPGN
jgi:hypothetical protein